MNTVQIWAVKAAVEKTSVEEVAASVKELFSADRVEINSDFDVWVEKDYCGGWISYNRSKADVLKKWLLYNFKL